MYFHAEDVSLPKLDFIELEKWIKSTIAEEGKKDGDVNIIFCSDKYLLEVNTKYLSHDYYTDIITFDYSDEETVSGDIFISIDRVGENSKNFSVNIENEFNRICIHGILHLLGYKDKSPAEKQIMTNKENEYLLKFDEASSI